MPKQNSNEREKLQELEKLVKRVIRKSLKNNTLDYTVQFTLSNLDNKVKYAAMISSPASGVQPITYVFDTYNDLKEALIQSETEINKKEVEKAFHESRINSYKNKIQQHEERIIQIDKGEDEEDEDIPMEEV